MTLRSVVRLFGENGVIAALALRFTGLLALCQPNLRLAVVAHLLLLSLVLNLAFPQSMAAQTSSPATIYLPLATNGHSELAKPVIQNFSATPSTINPGATSTLNWQVSGATTLTISGIGAVSGTSGAVQPMVTTEYTLTASNAAGATMARVTVTVNAAGPISYANYFLPYQFAGQIQQGMRPQVAVDPAAGIHVVYTAKGGGGYYGYCAANCTSTASFTMFKLGADKFGFQLALDANGHPRLFYVQDQNGRPGYIYAECNQNCTDATRWKASEVISEGSYSEVDDGDDIPAFALDNQGRPHFVYLRDEVNGDVHMLYRFCNTNCLAASNWQETQLSAARWTRLHLAFSTTGLPRLAFFANPLLADNTTLVPQIDYLECSTLDCTTETGPLLVAATPTSPSSAVQFALRLDHKGNPRLAVFPGTGDGGDLQSGRLFYFTCDANCATARENWTALDMGLPGHAGDGSEIYNGELGVDLALDHQDRPHIAFRISLNVGELGYTWCTTNCAQSMNGWQHVLFAAQQDADQELGHIRTRCDNCIPPLPDCQSFWNAGMWPSLALDPTGNPRVAFEVQLWSYGGCTVETLARLPRLVLYQLP